MRGTKFTDSQRKDFEISHRQAFFGAEQTQFPDCYTKVHLNHDGVRVPFVWLSGRWLEAFGFK